MQNEDRITYFAETDYRNKKQKFGIKASDRSRHLYVIGKTGMGKSTLLDNMAIQDINNGEGLAFLDPHGSSAELLLDYVPESRIDDVLYFAPFDSEYPISFNVLEDVGYDKRHLVVSGLMSTFEKIWADQWSARMAYILQNTLLALLEYPDATLLAVNRMYIDKNFRKKVVDNATDPSVKSFWNDEFTRYTDRFAQEATPAIQNKIGQFTANPLIRNIIGQPRTSFDVREFMDKQKIMIVNLSKGQIGESNVNLLGSMLVTKIYLSALSRADTIKREENKLPNFNLFVDEFQSFANKSFADILSEARKYGLNLHIAHQYVEQMPEEIAAAILGNVGTMITFRIGGHDAEVFEKEFAPQFTAEDMVNLGKFQMYLKLMVDGVSSAPFSAQTFPHIQKPSVSYKDVIIARSREKYATPREKVEKEILDWHEIRIADSKNEKSKNAKRPVATNIQQNRNNPPHPDKKTHEANRSVPNREAELRKAVSLDDLRKKEKNRKKRQKAKNPSSKNVDELRNALKEVLGEDLGKGDDRVEDKKTEPKETEVKKEEKQKEVPEHVLKKLLEME